MICAQGHNNIDFVQCMNEHSVDSNIDRAVDGPEQIFKSNYKKMES